MPQITNTYVPGVHIPDMAPNISESDQTAPVPPSPRAGNETSGVPGEWRPQLPKPDISMANMGLLLMSVQDKLTAQRLKTGEESVLAGQQKMKQIHEERARKLQEYFDKLAQSAPKSKGFFGRMISGFLGFVEGAATAIGRTVRGDNLAEVRKEFEAKMQESLDHLGKAFTENIGSIINIAVWGGLSLVTLNPFLLIGILPTILEEPELQELVAQVIGSDKETIGKWVFGINIALNVGISVVVGIAAGVLTTAVISVLTAGAGTGAGIAAGIAAGVVVGGAMAVVMGAAPLATGITEAHRTGVQAEAQKDGAEADRLKALYTDVQEELKREMGYLKSSMESISARSEATMKLFRAEQHALYNSAAV